MNYTKLDCLYHKFTHYIAFKDGYDGDISFRDTNRMLGREEDYKSQIVVRAAEELNVRSWKKSMIGTGLISKCVVAAVNESCNLINHNVRIHFMNKVNGNKDAEAAFYDLYCGYDDEASMNKLIDIFGARYSLIAYLFFIKDDSKYLPISPEKFDVILDELECGIKTADSCSWDNYQSYIRLVREVKEFLVCELPNDTDIRLIDAHSFLWVINGKKFKEWEPDSLDKASIEKAIERSDVNSIVTRVQSVVNRFSRSSEVSEETKRRAKGKCQLCGMDAPFNDRNNNPYLESHHIVWLSRGGEDSTNNTAALFPNCHKKMHVLDDERDVEFLKESIRR